MQLLKDNWPQLIFLAGVILAAGRMVHRLEAVEKGLASLEKRVDELVQVRKLLGALADQQNDIYEQVVGRTQPWEVVRDESGEVKGLVRRRSNKGET